MEAKTATAGEEASGFYRQGLIQIYTGTGKGKTTAAAGQAVRARGAGVKVLFVQFLKGRPSCEVEPLKCLGIEVRRTDPVLKFFKDMSQKEREECWECCRNLFAQAAAAMRTGSHGLVVLDEILDVVNHGIISQEELCRALRERQPQVEAVLTGRGPSEELCQMADYISDIQAVKHPYQKGIVARRGIEY